MEDISRAMRQVEANGDEAKHLVVSPAANHDLFGMFVPSGNFAGKRMPNMIFGIPIIVDTSLKGKDAYILPGSHMFEKKKVEIRKGIGKLCFSCFELYDPKIGPCGCKK